MCFICFAVYLDVPIAILKDFIWWQEESLCGLFQRPSLQFLPGTLSSGVLTQRGNINNNKTNEEKSQIHHDYQKKSKAHGSIT